MESIRQPTFRIPIIMLALFNLGILGARLWPWPDVMNLPGNGTTGIDPAITLAAYAGLGFWIGNMETGAGRKSLYSAALLGVLGGMFLIAQAVLAARQGGDEAAGLDNLQSGLMAAAIMVVGIVGLRTARAGNTMAFSTVCAIWASMVSSLMACTAVLAENFFAAGSAEVLDPWQQYEGFAISTPAMQALIHSLDTISGFLLVGPIVGCAVGAIFAFAGKPKNA